MNFDEMRGAVLNLTPGALTAAGGNVTVDIADIDFAIDGMIYNAAAQAGEAVPGTDALTGEAFKALQANQACAFLAMVAADGTLAMAQGPIVELDDDGTVKDATRLPAPPNDHCPIGYIRVVADSGASAWTIGGDNWNAAGITATATSLLSMPHRPPQS